MDLKNVKRIHCIAIGGIGVSALAKFFHHNGAIISGSDINHSEITENLKNKYNISITIGSNPDSITSDIDLVVYSPAVPKTDLEYERAKKLGIKLISYPEALGEISKLKKTIAISGTNGKTTTTSIITELLKYIDINPTVIIGGILQKYSTNFLYGGSEYFITEACEYKRSFLNIYHDILVITNITEDHLDYFSDLKEIQNTFSEFLNNQKENAGTLVCNSELENLKPVIEHAKEIGMKIIDYSNYLDPQYKLSIPGKHNKQNMAAALGVLEALGIPITKEITDYLAYEFRGTKRRMEYIGKTKEGARIYDDYAHNPEGISFLLETFREEFPDKKIVILFEPHLYSRTEDFKEEFGKALSQSDILYLFPVYKAREPHQPEKDFMLKSYIEIDEDNLNIVEHDRIFTHELLENKHYDDNYIIVTVGAGDIWKQGLLIKKQD